MPTLFRGNEGGAGGDITGEGERTRPPLGCDLAEPGERPPVSEAGGVWLGLGLVDDAAVVVVGGVEAPEFAEIRWRRREGFGRVSAVCVCC